MAATSKVPATLGSRYIIIIPLDRQGSWHRNTWLPKVTPLVAEPRS